MRHAAVIVLGLLILAGGGFLAWRLASRGEDDWGRELRNDGLDYELERVYGEVEDLSLEFEDALRASDISAVGGLLSADVAARIPAPLRVEPPSATAAALLRSETIPAERALEVSGWTAAMVAFGHWRDSLEKVYDLRFKLKSFDEGVAWERRVLGEFGLEVRGELGDGTPYQLEARCRAELFRKEEPWRIRRWEIGEQKLIIGRRRLFTEVTRAGGLETFIPDHLNIDGPFVTHADAQGSNATNLDYGGIACADANGDRRLDLYVCNAQGFNQLFINQGGGRFREEAQARGVRSFGGSRGAVFADFDADGDQDLFVTKATFHFKGTTASNELFINDGTGVFTEAARERGLEHAGESMSATFLDYDLDGDLDLYVCGYGHMGLRPYRSYFAARDGDANHLYRNRGDGTFEDVTEKAGVGDRGWSYAVAACDDDGDGDPDLYVVNDYGPNVLYRNRGDGTFEEVQDALGVSDPGNGMAAAWADVNGDGRFDLYTANMRSGTGHRVLGAAPVTDPKRRELLLKFTRGNSLFLSGPEGRFRSAAEDWGVAACGWAWQAEFLDVDRDGFEDLYVVNGYVTGPTRKDY